MALTTMLCAVCFQSVCVAQLDARLSGAPHWDMLLASVNRGDFDGSADGEFIRDVARALEKELTRCTERETLERSFPTYGRLVAEGFPWPANRPATRQIYFNEVIGTLQQIVPVVLECSRGTPCDPKILSASKQLIALAVLAFEDDLATSPRVVAAERSKCLEMATYFLGGPLEPSTWWYGMPIAKDYPDRMRRVWHPILMRPKDEETSTTTSELMDGFIAELRAIEAVNGPGCATALDDEASEWWKQHPSLAARLTALNARPFEPNLHLQAEEEGRVARMAGYAAESVVYGDLLLRREAYALMAKIGEAVAGLPLEQETAAFVVSFTQGAEMRIDLAREMIDGGEGTDDSSRWVFSTPRAAIRKFDNTPVTLAGREEFVALFAGATHGATLGTQNRNRWTLAWEGSAVPSCVVNGQAILGRLGGIDRFPVEMRASIRNPKNDLALNARWTLTTTDMPRARAAVVQESAAIRALWHASCAEPVTEKIEGFSALVLLESCEWKDACTSSSTTAGALRQTDSALEVLASPIDDPFRVAWLEAMSDRARKMPAALTPKVVDALTGWEIRRSVKP
jgi:hypothetical protein